MKTSTIKAILTGVLLLAATGTISAEDEWSIDWYSLDASGGVILAESDNEQWQLSGTIGQWEATEGRKLSGGDWDLTGGFWAMTLEELADLLFHDRFEEN